VKWPIAAGGVIAIVVLAAAVTALAANGNRPKIKFTAAGQDAARVAVLRRTDLRPAQGWTGGPTKPDLTPLTCANYHPKLSDLVVNGTAESNWARNSPPLLVYGSQATVLQSARMVRLDWQRSTVKAPGLLSCLRSSLVDGGATDVSATRIGFPRIAPCAAAFRFRYGLKAQGKTVRLITEIVGLCRGRTEVTFTATTSDVGGPTALSAEVLRLARLLVARSRA